MPIGRSPLPAALLSALLVGPAIAAGPAATGDFAGTVSVDGRSIYLTCKGSGSPAVVLISGYRNDGEIWTVQPGPGLTPVFDGVADFTRVCTYDRPGTLLDGSHFSRSDPVEMPRTADVVAEELRAVLKASGVPPPYVLVPHSLGGVFARIYAAEYPDDVAGMVLVDTWPEHLPELLGPPQWQAYVDLSGPSPPGLDYKPLEKIDFGAASDAMLEVMAEYPPKAMPIVVIARGKPVQLPPDVPSSFSPEAFEKAWRSGETELAAIIPGTKFEVAPESNHYVQLVQPELVIDAVKAVVDAVRDPATWNR